MVPHSERCQSRRLLRPPCVLHTSRPVVAKIKKRVRYMISADIARRPLLYPLGRQFGVEVNIRAGSMTEEGGVLVLDLVGEDGAVEGVISRLRAEGAEIIEGNGDTEDG